MLRTIRFSKPFFRRKLKPATPPRGINLHDQREKHRESMLKDRPPIDRVDWIRSDTLETTWMLGTYTALLSTMAERVEEYMPGEISFLAVFDTLELFATQLEISLNEMEVEVQAVKSGGAS